MRVRTGFEIPIRAKVTASQSTQPLFLLKQWRYDSSYQDPNFAQIPQSTPLKIGNIGYCPRSAEIILFFEMNGDRLVRAAEFMTESPFEELALAFWLSDQTLDIRYSSQLSSWRGTPHLTERVNFFNRNNKLLHKIDSDSHCLIDFPNGLQLSESAVRGASSSSERTWSFFIGKLGLGLIADLTTTYESQAAAFLKKHNLTVFRQPRNQLFFSNSTPSFRLNLVDAVKNNHPSSVQRYLNEGFSPDTKDTMTSYNVYDIAVEHGFEEIASMLAVAGGKHSAHALENNANLIKYVRKKNWKMVKFSLDMITIFVNIPLFPNESKTLLDLIEEYDAPPEIYTLLDNKKARRTVIPWDFSGVVNKIVDELQTSYLSLLNERMADPSVGLCELAVIGIESISDNPHRYQLSIFGQPSEEISSITEEKRCRFFKAVQDSLASIFQEQGFSAIFLSKAASGQNHFLCIVASPGNIKEIVKSIDINELINDPITLSPMQEPVMANDLRIYDQACLKKINYSPFTRERLVKASYWHYTKLQDVCRAYKKYLENQEDDQSCVHLLYNLWLLVEDPKTNNILTPDQGIYLCEHENKLSYQLLSNENPPKSYQKYREFHELNKVIATMSNLPRINRFLNLMNSTEEKSRLASGGLYGRSSHVNNTNDVAGGSKLSGSR